MRSLFAVAAYLVAISGVIRVASGQTSLVPIPDNAPNVESAFSQQLGGTATQSDQPVTGQNIVGESVNRMKAQSSTESNVRSGSNRTQLDSNQSIRSDLGTRNKPGTDAPPIPTEPQQGINQNLSRGIDGSTKQILPNSPSGLSVSDRNAPWRFQKHNGEWWYYTSEKTQMYFRDNQWQVYIPDTFARPQPSYAAQSSGSRTYSSGYRGLKQSDSTSDTASTGTVSSSVTGPAYLLQHDQSGREFICVNGQRIFFDNQSDDQNRQNAESDDRAFNSDQVAPFSSNSNGQTELGDANANSQQRSEFNSRVESSDANANIQMRSENRRRLGVGNTNPNGRFRLGNYR